MGWFWADATLAAPVAPHPLPRGDASPPPGCPMHKPSSTSKSISSTSTLLAAPTIPQGSCPYIPPDSATSRTSAPQPTNSTASTLSKFNPLNYMPSLSNKRESSHQSADLPLSRERSSIPKGDGTGNWEYPSPQQMYNAMLRKGYTDTDTSAVESMVAVHNFLNEGAWAEIAEWERRFGRGLSRGWRACKRGEAGTVFDASTGVDWDERREQMEEPRLVRFMGRPGELTPKARMLQVLAWAYPDKFGTQPPFDRHDWFVQRRLPGGQTREVRYVIDYYEGPPEPTGEPVFFLDVRPAVDGPTAALERTMRWGGDVWYRASGGSVREQSTESR
ncbi:hypothetical protein W97_04009 [Coniosporium apollinis CBS 100218]|uniref:Holocytochrome c-type synthase n=1 Tax=Coniosporium apollinis (strain CBS 100218) TaxID=1168221 RepID=R7YSZ0_CONA1|nr:uncharacterized protein W97_04009 [Coniosporium apollinis CBS 100218]EON64776.1 hypothetical protein W97_04009 [Coniosporium apollinis CBS 100218]